MDKYKKQIRRAERTPEYWAAVLTNDFAVQLHQRMKKAGLSQAELARRIGCSRAYVCQLLRGDSNFTVLTMAKVAMALEGAVVELSLRDRPAQSKLNSVWTPVEDLPKPTLSWSGGYLQTTHLPADHEHAPLATAA